MKIEKINDNQIRCTLSKADLDARKIKITDLAYGSGKAKELFREMVQQANRDFGFEVDDIPLMVEAIPLSEEMLVLVISKVDCPDELDSRFSRFSEPDEDYEVSQNNMPEPEFSNSASDILDLFREAKATPAENKPVKSAEAPKEERKPAEEKKKPADRKADLVKAYEFRSMNRLERLSGVLKDFYLESNTLYKNTASGTYLLILHKGHQEPELFNKVCNIASEYGAIRNYSPAFEAYLDEHAELIRRKDALQCIGELE